MKNESYAIIVSIFICWNSNATEQLLSALARIKTSYPDRIKAILPIVGV